MLQKYDLFLLINLLLFIIMQKKPLESKISSLLTQLSQNNLLNQTKIMTKSTKSTILPHIEKEQLTEILRKQYRKKWRDPGYVNKQFSEIPILKAKILNCWQLQRINMSKRTYEYPNNFKGIKIQYVGKQFPATPIQQLPIKTRKFIKKAQQSYKNNIFNTLHTIESYDKRIENIKSNYRNVFKKTNTIQNKEFMFKSVQKQRLRSTLH